MCFRRRFIQSEAGLDPLALPRGSNILLFSALFSFYHMLGASGIRPTHRCGFKGRSHFSKKAG